MDPGTILIVDDEPHVVRALERRFRLEGWEVLCAETAVDAIALLRANDVCVILADNQMPGTSGISLLARARSIAPDTMRILMTGKADLPTAIRAINQGEVFRFILKPWVDAELVATAKEASARRKLVRSLKTADDATILSLAQTIELKDPYTRGHCDRVAVWAVRIAERLGLPEARQRDIRYGSWLHDCGKIGVPEAVLNFPGPLDAHQVELVHMHPIWGADVARQAHLSPAIIQVILGHHERVDGKGYPNGLVGEEIPLEARIVGAADAFDAMTTDRPYKRGMDHARAIDVIRAGRGTAFDCDVADALIALVQERLDARPLNARAAEAPAAALGVAEALHHVQRR